MKILPLIALVALLCGCMGSQTQETTSTTAAAAQGTGCGSLPAQKDRDDCYLAKAREIKSISVCGEISDPDRRSYCVSDINSGLAKQLTTTTVALVQQTTTSATEAAPETTSSTEETSTTGEPASSSTTLAAATTSTLKAAAPVKLYFLDVGYGDSAVITTGKSAILTNCGRSPTILKSALEDLGIKKVEYLIMTQPTEQDYSGCADIMDWMGVNHILETGQEPYQFKSLYTKFEGLAIQRDDKHVGRGYNLTVDGVLLQVLNPLQSNPGSGDLKTNSLAYMLTYGKTRVFMGGACDSSCDALLGGSVSADILKVPNSGDGTGLSSIFIGRVKPKAAVVGFGPEIGVLPPMETMDRLKKDRIPTYFIASNGTIEVDMTPEGYAIKALGVQESPQY